MNRPDAPPPPLTALQRVSHGRFPSLIGPVEKPAYGLALVLAVIFVAELATGGPGRWGLSARTLAEGRVETILTHMFSHAGFTHFLLNATALAAFSSPLVSRFGWRAGGLRRYGLLFLLSGLSGAAVFLALNSDGVVPMVGASGAICGLWGAAARLAPDDRRGPLLPLGSKEVLAQVRVFAVNNAVLFAVLFVLARGSGGGLAWEAHLGGFLFGLFAMPLLTAPASGPQEPSAPADAPPAPTPGLTIE